MRAPILAALLLLVALTAAAQSGLPQRAPEPRTMREFWPVFLVLSLVWLGVVAFALRLSGPYGRIAEKLSRSREGMPRTGA